MDIAYIFSGQGSQKLGMGYDLYQKSPKARKIFNEADEILGYKFSDTIFNATEDVLMDTRNTQLALYIYQVVVALSQEDIIPNAVAGHSLGEYSALTISKSITFEDGLNLLKKRGEILHNAYKENPGSMGVVIGLEEKVVEEILADLRKEYNQGVFIANYNGPGQLVITGARTLIKDACKRFLKLGAKRALALPMKASGHSPLAQKEGELLGKEIDKITFKEPIYPIYQCADGKPHIDINEIKQNLKKHITHPVQWTSITENMVKDGHSKFYEIGADDTLQKIVQRMYPEKFVTSIWTIPTYNNINPYKLEEL